MYTSTNQLWCLPPRRHLSKLGSAPEKDETNTGSVFADIVDVSSVLQKNDPAICNRIINGYNVDHGNHHMTLCKSQGRQAWSHRATQSYCNRGFEGEGKFGKSRNFRYSSSRGTYSG